MPYAIAFNNDFVHVYEYGSLEGSSFSYTPDRAYDIRITLQTVGAIYEIKPADSAHWTYLHDSDTPAETPLKTGGMVYGGTFEIDDIRLEERYFTPQVTRTYTEPGVYPITLNVRDHAGQAASANTTITVVKNAPPVSLPGGPYTFEDGNYVRFVDNGSADDVAIMRYDWDFGDGTFGTEAEPTHFYTVPGTYEVSLTITDHALQTHTTTTTVGLSYVKGVDVSGVFGDWQTLQLTAP